MAFSEFQNEISIELASGTLKAKVWGPKVGKPILALHGWLDNAGSFDYLAPLLPTYRIVALDSPGHGNSDFRPAGSTYHFVDEVSTVIQVLNQLGWAQANLMGHSKGAGIAALVAGTFPDRIEKLALIEGIGPLTNPPTEAPNRLAHSVLQEAELWTKKVPIYSSVQLATKTRMKASGFSEKAAKPLIDRGLKKVEGGFTWKSDPRLTIESPLRMSEEQVLAFLSRISCPTLVIRAEAGLSERLLSWEPRLKAIKNLQSVKLPGHHHLHLEEPEPVAEVLQDFFDHAFLHSPS